MEERYRLLLLFFYLYIVNVHAKTQVYTVNEEAGPDAYIGNIPQDFDLPALSSSDSRREFSVLAGSNLVKVNEAGDLLTVVQLDREALCPRNPPQCVVNAEIFISPSDNIKLFKVQLIVEDLNDNVPSFPTNPVVKEISESATIGSLIRLDSAIDPDLGSNGINRYEIASSPPGLQNRNGTSVPHFDLYVLDNFEGIKIPEIRLTTEFDRETTPSYELLLYAIDGGRPALTGTATIHISVTDSNDNQPTFEQSRYVVEVKENEKAGFEIMRLEASDLDSGENAKIEYSFSSLVDAQDRAIFSLNSSTGVLSIKGPGLDYENSTTHHLTIEAKDGGPNAAPAYVTVVVNVVDINDEHPEISVLFLDAAVDEGDRSNPGGDAPQTILVKENLESGEFIAFVTVTDRDKGENGRVSCRLKDNSTFKMERLDDEDDRYYIKTWGELDRETKRLHNIEILARDHGNPSLSSSKTVVVELIDENDNDPSFAKSIYPLSVSENVRPGSRIAVLTAEDLDDGPNAEITYSARPLHRKHPVPFEIDPKNGAVLFSLGAKRLDAENSTGPFEMIVVATDNGYPPRSTNTTVVITVSDENDNPPRFRDRDYVFRIKEDVPVGFFVGTVVADDADHDRETNGRVTYSFDSGNYPFSIKTTTGEISFVGNAEDLDREMRESRPYVLTVTATDHGIEPLTDHCTVEIYLLDVNDNPPQVSFPNVTRDIIYLYVTSALYEKKRKRRASLNTTSKRAADNPLKNALLIGSSADNNVRFPDQSPAVVTQLQVHDPDEGENGRVRFVLSDGNPDRYFDVDSQTGSVLLNVESRDALREMKRGCHVIEVDVKDLGKPVLDTFTWVNVYVTDKKPGTLNATKVMRDCMNSSFYPPQFLPPSVSTGGFKMSLWMIIVIAVVAFLLILLIIVVIIAKTKSSGKKSRTYSCSKSNVLGETLYLRGSPMSGKKGSVRNFGNGTIDSRTSFSEWRTNEQLTAQEKEAALMPQEQLEGSVRSQNSAKDSGTGDSMPSDAYHATALAQKQAQMNHYYGSHVTGFAPSHQPMANVYLQPQGDIASTDDERSRMPFQLYPKCTQECRVYGHSDLCWMPEPTRRPSSRMTPLHGVDEYDGGSLKMKKRSMTPNFYQRPVDNARYVSHPSANFYYDPVSKFDTQLLQPSFSSFRDEHVDSDTGSVPYAYPASPSGHPAQSSHAQNLYSHTPQPYGAPSPSPYQGQQQMGKAYVNLQGAVYEPNGAMTDEAPSNISSNGSGNRYQNYSNANIHPNLQHSQAQSYPVQYQPTYSQNGYDDPERAGAAYMGQLSGYEHPYEEDFAANNLLLSPTYNEAGEMKYVSDRPAEQYQPATTTSFGTPTESENNGDSAPMQQSDAELPVDKLSTIREEIDADEVIAQIDGLLL